MTWILYTQLPQVLAVCLCGWLLLRHIDAQLSEIIQ